MRTLWLLRHAKAEAGPPGGDDHDRALAPRGREDAARLGRHLAQRGAPPGFVLCSSALRARETLAGVVAAHPGDWAVCEERELYLASAGELLRCVQAVPDAEAVVWLVGHNPGIGELMLQLATGGDAQALAELRRKVPTGALAELHVDEPHWRHLPRGGALASYTVPRQLRD